MALPAKRMPATVECAILVAPVDGVVEFGSPIGGINNFPTRLNGNVSRCVVCRQAHSDRCTFCSTDAEKFIVSSAMRGVEMKRSGELTVRCSICLEQLPIDAETGVRFILENPVECTRCGAPRASEQTSEFAPGFLAGRRRGLPLAWKDNGS
jgi:hypothetical protein